MNKPPATRRGDTPVNALTAFVRAASEGRYKGPVALGEAAGFTRQTAAKLLGDERPVLPKLPPRDTLEALARAFPDVGLARIEEIANKAVSPHDADLPLTRGDLKRAHTSDLRAELAERTQELEHANLQRREMRGQILALADLVHDELHRRLEEALAHLDAWAEGKFGDSWDEPLTGEGKRVEGLGQRLYDMRLALRDRVPVHKFPAPYDLYRASEGQSITVWVGFELGPVTEIVRKYAALDPVSDMIERDPLPKEVFEEDLDEILACAENAYHKSDVQIRHLVESHPLAPAEEAEVGKRIVEIRRKWSPPSPVLEDEREQLSWAARDWPEWAKKPDEEEDFDGGA